MKLIGILSLLLLQPLAVRAEPGPASVSLDDKYLAECAKYLPSEKRFARNPNNLTRAEMAAIYAYTYANFGEINGAFGRGEELDDCQKLQVALMDRGLAKLPVYSGIVYRGTRSKFVPGGEGETVILKPFTSTSPNADVAKTFIEDAFVTLKITSGRRLGVYSSEIGEGMSPDEEEVLLPHGSVIHLSKRRKEVVDNLPEEKSADGKKEVWVIEGEEVSAE